MTNPNEEEDIERITKIFEHLGEKPKMTNEEQKIVYCNVCGNKTTHYHIGFIDGKAHFKCKGKCCNHPQCNKDIENDLQEIKNKGINNNKETRLNSNSPKAEDLI